MEARSIGSIVLFVTVLLAACVTGPGLQGAVPVPNGHPATGLRTQSTSGDEFTAAARLAGLTPTCGKGGGPRPWEVCMLRADGVVAVIGFGDTTGIGVELTSIHHDTLSVPLEPGLIYGVPEAAGTVHLLIEFAGRQVGELMGEL